MVSVSRESSAAPAALSRGMRVTVRGAPPGPLASGAAAAYSVSMDERALVWFFDVDGTLLLTEGAGRQARTPRA